MKKWWYLIFFLILMPIVQAQYYYSFEYELTNILAILVGGGTPGEIFAKFLLWVVIFAVIFNKGALKFFGIEHRSLAVIVGLIVATLAVRFMPQPVVSAIFNNLWIMAVLAMFAGMWWVTSWVRVTLFKKIVFIGLCIMLGYIISILSKVEPYAEMLNMEYLGGLSLNTISLTFLVFAALGYMIWGGRKSSKERLEEKLSKTKIKNLEAEEKWFKKQRRKLK